MSEVLENPPVLGAEGEPCPACGAPLAADQRYCLNCGRRRAGPRVPYAALLAGRAPEDVLAPASSPAPPPPPPERRTIPVGVAGAGAGLVLVILALGVLLGAATSGEEQPRQVAAAPVQQRPPVINVTAAAPAADESSEEFVSDWPEGEEGFTVQLEALAKDSTEVADVDQAKQDAEAAGASEVGALDTDEFATLEPGNYVIYTGVYTGKKAKAEATKALKKLKKDFPDAEVVEVSVSGGFAGAKGTRPEEQVRELDEGQLEDLQQATGEEQQEKSAKLPDTVGLGGEPPATDDKKPGGGSDTQVIE
jgi:hypothetical protein